MGKSKKVEMKNQPNIKTCDKKVLIKKYQDFTQVIFNGMIVAEVLDDITLSLMEAIQLICECGIRMELHEGHTEVFPWNLR